MPQSVKYPWLINRSPKFTEETKICRYIGFDVLLQLLNKQFYVPEKEVFSDARECGKISKLHRFAFSIVSSNGQEINETFKVRQGIIEQYVKNLIMSKYLLTSCWTLNTKEDSLMWKSYTNDIGVCITTTVGELMNAIDCDKDGYIPICSPIIYGRVGKSTSFIESLFTKDKYYASEKEMRIYFIFKSDLENVDLNKITPEQMGILLLKASERRESNRNPNNKPSHIIFDFNPNCINSIIISPNIKSGTFQYFRKILQYQFENIFTNNNMIKQSEIQINKS